MNIPTDIPARLRALANTRQIPAGTSLWSLPKEWPGLLELEAASKIERLQAEVARLRTLIRVNALRWNPSLTHEEIDGVIDGQ